MTHVEDIRPLPETLRRHARERPDKVAFADERRQVTYAGLAARTGRLAGHLAAHGVGRGDRVAILLGNSVTTVESYLAVTRAAAVGVPVNPQCSDAELAHQLDDSLARAVVTDGTHLAQVERARERRPGLLVVLADGTGPGTLAFEDLAGTEPDQGPRDDLGLHEPAWILYTSGTTGAAKGVVSHQAGCLWSVHTAYQGVLGLGPDDRLLWPLPLFHSLAHILCVLGVTVSGAGARILPGFGARDVLEALRAEPYTMLLGVPTMYAQLLDVLRDSGGTAPRPRVCLVTGAATGPELATAVEEMLGTPLVDSYGSTETCGAITISRPDAPRPPGTCGTPVPGIELRLADPRTGRDVAAGEEGEVLVKSPALMLGYHNLPDVTAQVLRDGWYRTGDLARRDAEGRLAITGRVKELIIRAGENIHPGEIEAVLREVPGVRDAAAAGRPDPVAGEVPVAYVVPEADGWSPAEALAACRERLSYFKVPAELYETAALPVTGSGKVSRRRLHDTPARLRAVATGRHEHLWHTEWVPWEPPAPDPAPPRRWALIGPHPASLTEAIHRTGATTHPAPDLHTARRTGPYDAYVIAAPMAGAGSAGDEVTSGPSGAVDATRAGGGGAVTWPVAGGRTDGGAGASGPSRAAGVAAAGVVSGRDAGGSFGVQAAAGAGRTAGPSDVPAPADLRDLLGAAGLEGRVVFCTRGAVAARDGDAVRPGAAAASAWIRARRTGPTRLVDLGADGSGGSVEAWGAVLGAPDEETDFVVRGGDVLVPRLARVPAPAPLAAPAPGGSALVTGAGTDLARVLATHLVAGHGVRTVVLAAPDTTAAAPLAADLTALGATVSVRTGRADTTEGAAALLAAPGPDRAFDTVVHPVTRPGDAAAAHHLLALTRATGTRLTLCGTHGGPLRHPGPPATAAAGAYAAALAHAADHADYLGYAPAPLPGAVPLTDRQTADAFDAARTLPYPVLALRTDLWAPPSAAADRLRTLLNRPAPAADDTADPGGLRAELHALPVRARRRTLTALVRTEAARVLGLDSPERLDAELAFTRLGLTSLTAVVLRDRLAARTGLRLPVTLAFDRPTPAAVAELLDGELFDRGPAGTRAAEPAARRDDDPVAVVGMGCRYPGGIASPEDLWRLVAEGRDAIGEFPTDRGWDLDRLLGGDGNEAGTTATGSGGFLRAPGDFDAPFFGISPREALAMDPQQRLLLEVGWEALERAGIDPAALRGTDTGVYVGLMFHDYAKHPGALPEDLERLLGTGTAGSVASGRLAYTLGLNGPALTVDTACSSSLVALHLAAQALRRGECSLALAGGVAVMATPATFVEFSRQHGLAPDGRCKAFAEAADGTGWSEGVGLVVLERLGDARRNGHPVLAVLRGSAVNQDGASNGLTAPSGPAQQRVVRRALADAGLTPADVDAVEAHGTGTVLGDPIEAQALLATYGRDRDPRRPLLLGSLKSNIGHSQAAAGVGGVIKTVEAIRRGELPRTLHIDRPTPAVDWTAGSVRLLLEHTAWPETGRERRAAVSSFGVSGTNAHVILEQAPAARTERTEPAGSPASRTHTHTTVPDPATAAPASPAPAPATAVPASPVPVLLSARTPGALRAQARRLLDLVRADPGLRVPDVAAALATTRTAFPWRAAFTAGGREELERRLTAVASGADPGTGPDGVRREGGLAIGFTGQGAQLPGMGRELHAVFPEFARAFDAVCAALDPYLERPLKEIVWAPEGTPESALLSRTDFTQAGLFALETAMFRLLESWGVAPDAVLGHSLGGLTATHVCGALPLPDAALLVATRGRLMAALPPGGAMTSVEATAEEVRAVLPDADAPGHAALAAINGPRSVVVSGDAQAVEAVAEVFRAQGRRVTRLRVSHAFHSRHMDPILDELRAVASRLTYQAPVIPLVSGVTGRLAGPAELAEPEYWARHARDAVHFADAVRALPCQGIACFLELGPDAMLTTMARDCVADRELALCGGLRRGRSEVRALLDAVARAHAHGATVDWARYFAGLPTRRVDLPVYPFEHRRYWLRSVPLPADSAGTTASARETAVRPPAQDAVDPAGHRLRAELAGLSEEQREQTLVDLVRTEIAEVAGFEGPEDVEAYRSAKDLGLDSVSAVELRNRLVARTGLTLPTSLAFDHPTAVAMARHLLTELPASAESEAEVAGHDAGHDDGGAEGGMGGATAASAGTGPRTVFGALARLEAGIERERPDAAARARLADRLRTLTARLLGEEAPGSAGYDDSADLGERLDAATTDELFDLIDNELNRQHTETS
ncbi:beta-ketoacyl synthase N-terminal-like domain-containing protein [Streptomyces sp. NPDC052301]|uniref:beta-ketoacyl synthase N-terminal-like domain-containing protein n=1 Tax=Streptomyces sp. NPDC052301 TaxID=3365687 RepID=UPI0037D174D5